MNQNASTDDHRFTPFVPNMARYNRLLEIPRDDFFSLETSTTLQLNFSMAWLERLTAIVTVRMLVVF